MINLIFDSSIFKILSLFSISPGSKFRRKEIKEKTKLNNVPLDAALSRAVDSGIIKREKNLYSINFEDEYAKQIVSMISQQYKKMKELPFDIYCLLADISYICSMICAEAYLFGSYSKLVYRTDSDVDIAILECLDKKHLEKKVQKLERIYRKKIELHFFEKSRFYKSKKDPLVADIIRNRMRII
jgi:predicted nucleotidyltransferase